MVTWIKWSEGVAQGGRYIPSYQPNDDAMASFQLPVERFGDRIKNLKRERKEGRKENMEYRKTERKEEREEGVHSDRSNLSL